MNLPSIKRAGDLAMP